MSIYTLIDGTSDNGQGLLSKTYFADLGRPPPAINPLRLADEFADDQVQWTRT